MALGLVVPRVGAVEGREDAERQEADDECESEHVRILDNVYH